MSSTLARSAGWSLACAALIASPGCSKWSAGRVSESQRRGAAIIAALEVHLQTVGSYPTALGDLVPQYLKRIDPPVAGNGCWQYIVVPTGDEFTLMFEDDDPHKPSCWYRSRTRTWSLDTK